MFKAFKRGAKHIMMIKWIQVKGRQYTMPHKDMGETLKNKEEISEWTEGFLFSSDKEIQSSFFFYRVSSISSRVNVFGQPYPKVLDLYSIPCSRIYSSMLIDFKNHVSKAIYPSETVEKSSQ